MHPFKVRPSPVLPSLSSPSSLLSALIAHLLSLQEGGGDDSLEARSSRMDRMLKTISGLPLEEVIHEKAATRVLLW